MIIRITRKQIVDAARAYLGTPFTHQGRRKGKGIDCVGLTICVARDLDLISESDIQSMPMDYAEHPDMEYMRKTVSTYMDAIWPPDVGDWVYLAPMVDGARQKMAEPTHFAMISSDRAIIHADSQSGGVVEHPFRLGAMRLAKGAYRYRGVG